MFHVKLNKHILVRHLIFIPSKLFVSEIQIREIRVLIYIIFFIFFICILSLINVFIYFIDTFSFFFYFFFFFFFFLSAVVVYASNKFIKFSIDFSKLGNQRRSKCRPSLKQTPARRRQQSHNHRREKRKAKLVYREGKGMKLNENAK